MILTDAWVKYFSEQFAPLNAERAGTWMLDIRRWFGDADDSEVIRAIRSMTEDPRCPQEFPKIKNLLFHIFNNRKIAEEKNTVPSAACGMCHPSAPGYVYQSMWIRGLPTPHEVCTPCCCSLGIEKAREWAKTASVPAEQSFAYLKRKAQAIARWRQEGNTAEDTMKM